MAKKQRRLPKYKLVDDLVEAVRATVYSYPDNGAEKAIEQSSQERLIRAIEHDKDRIRDMQKRIIELSKIAASVLDPPVRNDKIIPILSN